jgi:hypothetical protein
VAESANHRRMKLIVRRELEGEGYDVQEEPLYPPTGRISWASYRPDLLGHRHEGAREEFVIAECETHPNMKRFRAKNFSSVWFQPYLFQAGSIRRILAVPRGSLPAVDLRLRDQWEVWVLGDELPMYKIGLLGRTGTRTGNRPAPAQFVEKANGVRASFPIHN